MIVSLALVYIPLYLEKHSDTIEKKESQLEKA